MNSTTHPAPLPASQTANSDQPLGLLNAPVLTNDGTYTVVTVGLANAREMAARNRLESAIGHEATARILSVLLGVDCPMNRRQFKQQPGQLALVFRLKQRLPEGVVLTRVEDIEAAGFEFGLLTRTA